MKHLILLYFALVIIGCNNSEEPKKLAIKNCSSCHQFPNPNLLPQKEWNTVLDNMGLRLGIINKPLDSLNIFEKEIFNNHPQITKKEWAEIHDYFINNAPQDFAPTKMPKLEISKGLFEYYIPTNINEEIPNITAIKIDPKTQQIYSCDEVNKEINFYDRDAKYLKSFKGLPTISNIQITSDNKLYVTYIGKSIKLTKQKNGYSEYVDGNNTRNTKVQLRNLYRPTQSETADLNKDGINEFVTCEFGVNDGNFTIKNNNYQDILNENRSGAIHFQIVDINSDGLKDVVTLYAQGNEELVCYKNLGNLKFERIRLIQFPPVMGSNYFEIVDLNHDKLLDIVYISGDNADYSITRKPYHGIYLFTNNGKGKYIKTNFLPVDGATKALCRDFDLDGDIDIASIAFFSDFDNHSISNFIYFENANYQYKAKGLDIQKHGRWLVMDAEDIDRDGDLDIALGSHPYGESISTFPESWRYSQGILLLKNQTR